jgi:hypothetical protein
MTNLSQVSAFDEAVVGWLGAVLYPHQEDWLYGWLVVSSSSSSVFSSFSKY